MRLINHGGLWTNFGGPKNGGLVQPHTLPSDPAHEARHL